MNKKNLRLFILIFFVGGAVALGAGSLLAVRTVKFARSATRTVGVVMDNVMTLNNADNQVSYHPKITFRTREGLDVTVISPDGSTDAEFRVGEQVAMLYDPRKPTNAVIDSFWHRWALPIILNSLGLAALMAAAVVKSPGGQTKVQD